MYHVLLTYSSVNEYLDWLYNLAIVNSAIKNMGEKKLDSICCPQWRETKADIFTEANRRRGPGTREKVSLRRINLAGNKHVQEINICQLPV
jgi:hypothetical protein